MGVTRGEGLRALGQRPPLGETPTPGGKWGEAWPCSAFHEVEVRGKPGWLPSEGHGEIWGVKGVQT